MEATEQLGRVPVGLLSPQAALEHGMDQRATVLFVAHLASALLREKADERRVFCMQRARLQLATTQPGVGLISSPNALHLPVSVCRGRCCAVQPDLLCKMPPTAKLYRR